MHLQQKDLLCLIGGQLCLIIGYIPMFFVYMVQRPQDLCGYFQKWKYCVPHGICFEGFFFVVCFFSVTVVVRCFGGSLSKMAV